MSLRRWWYTLPLRLRSLFGRRHVEAELDEEIRYHLSRQIQHHLDNGLSYDEARQAAMRDFGGIEQRKEECRDARSMSFVENAVRDFRLGLRALRQSPGFALAALATLALGIGATTAVFSVVYSVVLKPLPYRQPERLVGLWTTNPQLSPNLLTASVANYRDWRESSTVFEDIGLARLVGNYNLTGDPAPERVQGARVTASLFRVLGVEPMFGRIFPDDTGNVEDKVVLSYGLWKRRFAGDPGIVGQVIRLNGNPYTVTGIMPPTFIYPSREFELWTPFTVNPVEYQDRIPFSYASIARLRDGVSLAGAQRQMSDIAKRLENVYPANRGVGFRITPMLDDIVGNVRAWLYVILGSVICLLLIGCANLTNLVMTRSLGRRREIVVRVAMGAPRARLLIQSVMEMVPLIVLGGTAGVLLANWMVKLIVPLLPAAIPRIEAIRVDLHVLGFSAAMLFAMALVAAIWPALHVMRWNIAGTLHESSRTVTGGGDSSRIRDAMVVSQIAAVVMLMVGAALLIRSFAALKGVDPGFRPDNVLSVHLAIPRSKYRTDFGIAQFCKRILDRVTTLPGVQSAGMVNRLPLSGSSQIGLVEFEGSRLTADQLGSFDWRTVTPGYFRTLGIPLIQGRSFEESDTPERPFVGIIDEVVARRVWPNENPIGKRFRVNYPGDNAWLEIVGVVGHLRHDSLDTDLRPQVYWNYHQRAQDRVALVVRANEEIRSITGSVISAIHAIDPEQPVYDVRPMNEVLDRSVAPQWLMMTLLSLFAAVSLVLATVGVYGVLSYSVGMRRREIGIRMALGSKRSDIIWMVLRYGATLAGIGLAIGLTGALALSRVLGTLLYGITATDAFSFASASLVLLLVALAACYLPARRAAALDPVTVLRMD